MIADKKWMNTEIFIGEIFKMESHWWNMFDVETEEMVYVTMEKRFWTFCWMKENEKYKTDNMNS